MNFPFEKSFLEPASALRFLPTATKVITAMTEPHRIYHNLGHALEVYRHAYERDMNTSIDAVIYSFMAFYHDIVYVPGRSDNEERSAQMFLDHRPLLFTINLDDEDDAREAERMVDVTHRAILLSKNHFAPEAYTGDRHIDNFLDYDLLGLAASKEVYDLNSRKIRLEYANVSDEEWRIGRSKFLEGALSVHKIFRNQTLDMEGKAMLNMEAELKTLR